MFGDAYDFSGLFVYRCVQQPDLTNMPQYELILTRFILFHGHYFSDLS